MYYHGYGTERNLIKAMELFQKLAEKGLEEAVINLANIYFKFNKCAEALELYQAEIDKGNERAFFLLGCEYFLDRYIEKDEEKAFEFFQQGSEKGDPFSMMNMALMLIKSDEVRKDEKRASDLSEKAYTKAIELYKKKAENGNEKAQKKLLAFSKLHESLSQITEKKSTPSDSNKTIEKSELMPIRDISIHKRENYNHLKFQTIHRKIKTKGIADPKKNTKRNNKSPAVFFLEEKHNIDKKHHFIIDCITEKEIEIVKKINNSTNLYELKKKMTNGANIEKIRENNDGTQVWSIRSNDRKRFELTIINGQFTNLILTDHYVKTISEGFLKTICSTQK